MGRLRTLVLLIAAIGLDVASSDLTTAVVSYNMDHCTASCSSANRNIPQPTCPEGYTLGKTEVSCFNCSYTVTRSNTFPFLKFSSDCPCTDWTSCAVDKTVPKSSRCSTSSPAMAFKAGLCTVDVNAIALRYAPRVWLAVGEPYYPSSVDYFFDHTRLEGESYLPSTRHMPATGRLVTRENLPEASDRLPFFDGVRTLTNVPVYALMADRTGYLDLHYWTFYPYNRGKSVCIGIYADNKCIGVEISGHCIGPRVNGCIGGYSTFGHHVGDWETVTVRLKDGKPHAMYLSAHGHDGTSTGWYEYNSMLNVFYGMGQTIQMTGGTHPVVYEAWGSHGLYPTAGEHVYKRIANGVNLADETGKGAAWDTWKNVKAIKYQPNAGYTGDWTWLNFDGRWGNDKRKCLGTLIAKVIGGDQCILESGPSSINSRGGMKNGDS